LGYRVRKVDANQTDIVQTFRALGCSVEILSSVGNGCPDLLVSKGGRAGWCIPVEVKSGKWKLTADQEEWVFKWRGPYAVVETPEQARQLVVDMMLRTSLGSSKGCCGACSCRPGSGG
jgi:hypothetical protein